MIEKSRIEEVLIESGALLHGHFILASGRHSDRYMQCAQILQYPRFTRELAACLAEEFAGDNIDAVIAPAVGGIIIGYEIARRLDTRNLFAERENGVLTIRRNFTLPKGSRTLIVEDVVTTGGTVFELIDVVLRAGGEIAGVALIADRSGGTVDFGVKTRAAYTTEILSYTPDECPLCKEGDIPAVKPGTSGTR